MKLLLGGAGKNTYWNEEVEFCSIRAGRDSDHLLKAYLATEDTKLAQPGPKRVPLLSLALFPLH